MNAKFDADGGAEETAAPRKKRILIVDDDASVRESIASVLRGSGYDVSQSGDGQQALTQFDPRQLDLVLLELGLPNKSGWDTFEGFTGRNPTLSIIVITSQFRHSEIAMAAGVGALMEKPLDAGQLLQTIADLLNESVETRLRRRVGYSQDGRYMPPPPHYIPAHSQDRPK